MSLINKALDKSRRGGGDGQDRVFLGAEPDDTQTLAYKRRKGLWKGENTVLRYFILGILVSCIIVLYFMHDFTSLISQFGIRKKVEARFIGGTDPSLFTKLSKETTHEKTQEMAKAEPQPVVKLEGEDKDVVSAPPQVKESGIVEQTPSEPDSSAIEGVTDVTKPVQEAVPLVEVQTVKPSEAETQIPEDEVIAEVQTAESPKAEAEITESKAEEETQVSAEQQQSKDAWYAAYHFGMGVFYQKSKDIEKAIEEYKKVVELDPDNAEVHINLGVIYKDTGDLDKAVEEYGKALAIDPGLEIGHNNLGVIYFLKGNYVEAIKHYQKAVEINPKNLESYTNLGIVYGMQKRRDEAIKAFQTAIFINPQHAETQYNLAVIYDENGEIENALLHYLKFLEHYHAPQSELIDRVKRRINVLSSKKE